MKTLLFSLLFSLLLCACGTQSKTEKAQKLIVGEWTISHVNGKEIQTPAGEEKPFLGFSANNRVYGNVGCNLLNGSYKVQLSAGYQLTLSNLGTTRMLCRNMQTERAILNTLDRVSYYALAEPNELWLLNAEHSVVMRLTQRKKQAR